MEQKSHGSSRAGGGGQNGGNGRGGEGGGGGQSGGRGGGGEGGGGAMHDGSHFRSWPTTAAGLWINATNARRQSSVDFRDCVRRFAISMNSDSITWILIQLFFLPLFSVSARKLRGECHGYHFIRITMKIRDGWY